MKPRLDIPRGEERARKAASLPLSPGKFDRILELARGKEVLDVGCVGGEFDLGLERTSHARLASVARSRVGIDIVPNQVARWRESGYDAVVANAETMNLGRLFDLVVAADVLDHLANPARFLEAVHEHLRADGLLAIVAPNALSLNHALRSLAAVRIEANPEHTCWYDRTTLGQLLARHGFEAIEEYWQDYQTRPHTNLVRLRRNLATHLIVIARPLTTGAGQ